MWVRFPLPAPILNSKMKKQDIIDLWKKFDIDSIQKYRKFLSIIRDKEHAQHLEYVDIVHNLAEKLDYDKINPKQFWLACDEVFSIDPICNITQISATTKNIQIENIQNDVDFANNTNLKIAKQSGMLGLFDLDYENICVYKGNDRCRVGEIGTGLGCFKKYVEKFYPKVDYLGFDVVSRVENCVELEDGYFSEEYVEQNLNCFDIFYSCNVFQHISIKAIEKYFEQISKMLKHTGYFLCSGVSSGNGLSNHYGQIIKCPSVNDTVNMATKHKLFLQSTFVQQGSFSIFYNNFQKIYQ